MEGTDESDAVGVSLPANDGVRAEVGVRGSTLECREEGVCGNRIRLVEGVFNIRFVVGVPRRLEGVTGKGTANSRSFFVGDFDGEREAEREGDPGGCVAARIEDADGDLGDDEARRRVRFEGFAEAGKEGKSAVGIRGTDSSFA